jgi:hypothetical protein
MRKSILALMLALALLLLSACGNVNNSDVVTTTSPSYSFTPIFPKFHNINDFAEAVRNKDAEVAKYIDIENMNDIIYPEIKIEGYSLIEIIVISNVYSYYFYPEELVEEDYIIDEEEGCVIDVFPSSNGNLEESLSQKQKYVILEDGTWFCEAEREFFFVYNNKICCLRYPKTHTGEISIESFIEMKNMLIEE